MSAESHSPVPEGGGSSPVSPLTLAVPACGIITLLTDFGLTDPYVGVMKGVILGIAPQARVVDLTHGIPPQGIRQGALALKGAWGYFPAGTVHVAVVDPGVGSARAPVVVAAGGHYFVGPDNGILTGVLDQAGAFRAWRLEAPAYRLPQVSRTFHGRDIFAPAAAWLVRGVGLEALGPEQLELERLSWPAVRRTAEGVWGEVVQVDAFGNLITNLPAGLVAEGWRAGMVAGRRLPLVETYAGLPVGEPGVLAGSAGWLEVAVNRGSAAERLGLGLGAPVGLVGA